MLTVFNSLWPECDPTELLIDRFHRVLGPHSADPTRLRDVLCKLHYYMHKEELAKRVWHHGYVAIDGAQFQFVPDMSRVTLQRRVCLKPLLHKLQEANIP